MHHLLSAIKKIAVLNRFKLLLIGLFLIAPYSTGHAQDADIHSVAVMPFVKGENPQNMDDTLNCPFAAICFDNENVSPGADNSLTFMLYNILGERLGDRLMPMDRADQMYTAMKINNEADTPAVFAKKLGKSLNVKYMVVGNVWRYKNRTGTAFATDRPSSVAFSLYLIDVEKNELIWTGTYDETQQALTENLLNAVDFFKQGARWLTVDEFAEYGMKKILDTFPLK